MSSAYIFLSKKGVVSGPYTPEVIREWEETGELFQYTWIFRDPAKGWEPCPKKKTEKQKINAVLPPVPPPDAPSIIEKSESPKEKPTFWVICHNFDRIISGKAEEITSKGCRITHVTPLEISPVFKKGMSVTVNLLEEKSGCSENIKAKMGSSIKKGGRWIYQVIWKEQPKIFETGQQK